MDIKKNVNDVANAAQGAAVELKSGMKGILLSREIQKELDGGAALEDIVFRRVPTLDVELLREDVRQLQAGIQSVRDTAQQTVDRGWVERRLTDALSELDNGQRAAYLRNMVAAVTAAYPGVTLDSEAAAVLAELEAVEEPTDADVRALLEITSTLLPQFGELLQRSSAKAMIGRMHELDHDKVVEQIDDGVNAVTAYAAACYVMQKCGKTVKIDGAMDERTPAFAIGAAAAGSVEASKVMELYSAGKLTMEELAGKLKSIWTAVVTYASSGVIQAMALGLYGLTALAIADTLFSIFIALGAYLYFSPVWLIVGAFLGSALLMGSTVTVKDFEDLLQGAWDVLKELWGKLVSLWRDLTSEAETEAVAEEATEAAEVEELEEEAEEDEETEDEEEEELEPNHA